MTLTLTHTHIQEHNNSGEPTLANAQHVTSETRRIR